MLRRNNKTTMKRRQNNKATMERIPAFVCLLPVIAEEEDNDSTTVSSSSSFTVQISNSLLSFRHDLYFHYHRSFEPGVFIGIMTDLQYQFLTTVDDINASDRSGGCGTLHLLSGSLSDYLECGGNVSKANYLHKDFPTAYLPGLPKTWEQLREYTRLLLESGTLESAIDAVKLMIDNKGKIPLSPEFKLRPISESGEGKEEGGASPESSSLGFSILSDEQLEKERMLRLQKEEERAALKAIRKKKDAVAKCLKCVEDFLRPEGEEGTWEYMEDLTPVYLRLHKALLDTDEDFSSWYAASTNSDCSHAELLSMQVGVDKSM